MPSHSIAFLSHMAVCGGAEGRQQGGNCRQWKSSGLTGHCDVWKNYVNLYKVAFAKANSTWIWFWKEEIILPPYFIMLIVFSGQVTQYLKHPTAFPLQIKRCLLFPLVQAWPLLLPPSASLWHLNLCGLSQCMRKPFGQIERRQSCRPWHPPSCFSPQLQRGASSSVPGPSDSSFQGTRCESPLAFRMGKLHSPAGTCANDGPVPSFPGWLTMLREVQLGGYSSHPQHCSKFSQDSVLLYPEIAMISWSLRAYRHRVRSNGSIFRLLFVLLSLDLSKSPGALADAQELLYLCLLPALGCLVYIHSPYSSPSLDGIKQGSRLGHKWLLMYEVKREEVVWTLPLPRTASSGSACLEQLCPW